MEMAASETSHFSTVSSHHAISDIMIAEMRLEAGAVLAKVSETSDPTFSFQTALTSRIVFFLGLSEICNRVNTMIVSLLLEHLSLTCM